jgi:hypothetical protein
MKTRLKSHFTASWHGYKARWRNNMDAKTPISLEFEQEVRAAMSVQDPDLEFLASLKAQILDKEASRRSPTMQKSSARPAWMRTFGALSLIVVVILALVAVSASLPGIASSPI